MTRLKGSLTLRIFLMTGAMLMAACVITYGAIACLTPLSYTSLLEDELNRATDALLLRLSEINDSQCESLLANMLDNVLMNAILYSPIGAAIVVRVKNYGFSAEFN